MQCGIVEYNSACGASYFSSAKLFGEPEVYELQFDQERETKIRV